MLFLSKEFGSFEWLQFPFRKVHLCRDDDNVVRHSDGTFAHRITLQPLQVSPQKMRTDG